MVRAVEGLVRASVLGPIVAGLDERGADAETLLQHHGFRRSQLDDPYAMLPLARYVTFFEAAAAFVGDPCFGLRIGEAVRPSDLGPAGLLFASAPSLRHGLLQLGRYITILQSRTCITLEDHGAISAWSYKIEDPDIRPRIQDTLYTLMTMRNLIRSLMRTPWSPIEVHVDFSSGKLKGPLEKAFRAPILFGQPVTSIILDARDLDRPIRTEDRGLTIILERHARDLLRVSDGPATLSARVSQLIATQMGRERIAAATIADHLGMSARSLQRGLAEEGTSLRALLRDHRMSTAESLLGEGERSHADIAHAIGYADGTVFWRAFKSWTGATPRSHRRREAKLRT